MNDLFFHKGPSSLNEPEVYSGLTQIFQEQFRDPALVIAPHSSPKDVPGWDSGAMVSIVMAVEEHFDVEFAPRDLRDIRTVGDLAQLVLQYRS